jgi:TonB family protein
MVRIAIILLCAAAASGHALGQETALDAKDPSITERAAVDQAQTAMAPAYPIEAVRAGLEGRVSISTCIDASGKPYAPEVAKSSGHVVLDQAALDWTATGMRFRPAKAAGQAVAVCNYRFVQDWKLPSEGPAPSPEAKSSLRARDGTELVVTKRPLPDAKNLAQIWLDYPSEAIRKKLEGSVKLAMCIDTAGKADSVSILESSGHQVLDEAARKWFARNARLQPAEVEGKPVEVCSYTITWVWSLP